MTLVDRLREIAAARYHDKHAFSRAMHDGELTREQLRGWVANRYYYQTRIPIKDALIVAKSEDPAFRRAWVRRIHDHDGTRDGEGGLAQWLRLGEGVGLPRGALVGFAHVLPEVRAACDRYVALVREEVLVVVVASSLTELFAPDLMAQRIAAWERCYPWVDRDALAYFRGRVTRARRDGDEALQFVLANVRGAELEERCLSAFRTKCDILWALLDAVVAKYGIGGGE